MAIYTLEDLRAAVPRSMRDLSDDELVRDYSTKIGRSFEDTANYLGMKPRGTLSEMGRQLVGGAVVDVPKMVGQGLQYMSEPGRSTYETGKEWAQAAEARAPGYVPDMRERGLGAKIGIYGARGVAPVAAIAPAAFVPVVGEGLAAAGAATLFGTSSAQETYEKLRSQGISEEDSIAAARRVGLIQGPLEGLATLVGARAFKPLGTALRGAETTAGVAAGLTQTSAAKSFAKGFATNLVVQPATEVAQDVGASLVERSYGAKPEDLGELASQSAMGGLGLTMLLGPLAFGAHRSRAKAAAELKSALYDEDTAPEVRAQAMDMVMTEAKRQGIDPQNIDQWFDQQLQIEDQRNAALKAIETEHADEYKELTKGITTKPEPIDLQAHIDNLLGITPRENTLGETDLLGTANLTPLQRMALAGPTVPRAAQQELPSGEADLAPQPVTGGAAALTPMQRQALLGPESQVVSPPGGTPAVSPVTPVVAGALSQGTQRGTQASQTQQAKAQGPELSPAESAKLTKILEDVDSVDVGNVLPATVRGASTVKAPGKVTIDQSVLKNVRDALVHGKEVADEKTQQIVDALQNFADAYHAYLNQGGQVVSRRERLPKTKTPAQTAEAQVSRTDLGAANVQATLAELGEAVGGNAKNVEAVVRLVKDMVQGKIVMPGKTRAEVIQAAKKLDTRLSMAWAAAKRETFMNAQPDLADVRGSEVRNAREQAGEVSPLEQAATEGVSPLKGKGEKQTGLKGVLQYIRNHGTPFERMLAVSLRDVLSSQDNQVTLEFIDEGESRFDPKTNTVYLHRTASPEVALHEALHAALQSFIYNHPKDPMVMQLKKSLKDVVNYKGELTGKAKEVQDLLAKLVAEKNELDAVLELVSYGTTLNDFRKALEAMPTKGVPQSFRESANRVWQYIKAVMARMLGKPNTVAADVLDTTMALLERSTKEARVPNTGQVLEASIKSEKPLSDEKAAAALGLREPDYSRWAEKNAVNVLSTQRLFEAVGWSEENAQKLADKLAAWGRDVAKQFPSAEIIAGLLNSRYHGNRDVSNIQDEYKNQKNNGYQVAERIANYIAGQTGDKVLSVFNYLDGDTKALDGMNDGGKLKGLADLLRKDFDVYVSALSDVEQRFFKSRKFSENLLFPSRTEEIARGQFGLGKINAVLGKKSEFETEIDPDWTTKDTNGDPVISGDFYRVFKINSTLKGKPEHAGFMSAARFQELGEKDPLGYSVDTTRKWILESGDADKGKFKFTTNTTAREKITDEKADDLANALRNTIAALANNYASKNFISAMAKMGKGDSMAQQVAFDSIDEINEEYGSNLQENDDRILQVSQELSRSEKIRDLYRMSGTWVQLPDSPVYGELAGKFLPGQVWNSMIDMFDRQPLTNFRAVNTTMRWFKKSKTTQNFGTHVTNAAANVSMAMMHDISFKTMRDATDLLFRYEVRPQSLKPAEREMVEAFIKSGAMLGDYSSAEVKQALYEAHERNLRGGNDMNLGQRVAGWLGIEKAKAEMIGKLTAKGGKFANKVDDVLTQTYAFEDNAFRMAAFMKKAGELQLKNKLKTPTEDIFRDAGKFALKAFGDYDIDSKAVKALRQSFLPFISWTYAMAPVIARIALTQPWKVANIVMAYWLLEAAMGAAAGGDDEELRKSGPAYVRERMFGGLGPYMHIRIPFMGDDENPVYYKLGDYFPVATMAKGSPLGVAGQSWFPSALTPSGPLSSAFAGIVLGVDPYTGKSIHQPTDTQWQKLWNSAKFAYDVMMPPSINSKQLKKADDFFEGNEGVTGNKASGLVFARMAGLKLYDYNVTEEEARQDFAAKRIQREFKDAMRKAKREEERRGYPDYDALDKTLDDLQDRMEEAIAKARAEED